jgi:hypothetical protein
MAETRRRGKGRGCFSRNILHSQLCRDKFWCECEKNRKVRRIWAQAKIPPACRAMAIAVHTVVCTALVPTQHPVPRPAQQSAPANMHHRLEQKVVGFYPFAESKAGVMGWLFRDTHQAIIVHTKSESPQRRLIMDFMTEGGQTHPVWYDEATKWHVLLGGSIRGEVRIRESGLAHDNNDSSKLGAVRNAAEQYPNRMNIYNANCRHFAARIRREVERLNIEADSTDARRRTAIADVRLWLALAHATLLPALYPASILLICAEGLRDL